ncbi:6624_t:CDS:2, partial [Gigaspora margarita]
SLNQERDSENSIELNINLEQFTKVQKFASNIFQLQCTSIKNSAKVVFIKYGRWQRNIGRIAYPIYPQWKTESEVAVMELLVEAWKKRCVSFLKIIEIGQVIEVTGFISTQYDYIFLAITKIRSGSIKD